MPKTLVMEVEGWKRPWKTMPKVRYAILLSYTTETAPVDKLAGKAQKITIKLPWEIATIYSEVLKQSGHQSDDEEDEDDIEAHEASVQRLKVWFTLGTLHTNQLRQLY